MAPPPQNSSSDLTVGTRAAGEMSPWNMFTEAASHDFYSDSIQGRNGKNFLFQLVSVYLDLGYEDENLLHLNFYRKCQRVEVNIYLSYKICPSSSQSTSHILSTTWTEHHHHKLCSDQSDHCPDYDVVVREVTSFCNQDPLIIFTRAAAASREPPGCFYDKLVRVHDEQGWIFVYLLILCLFLFGLAWMIILN